MQVISLSAQAVEVARVALRQDVCKRVSHDLNMVAFNNNGGRHHTAHAGRPENTDAVTEARGTVAVGLGCRAETVLESVANPVRAIHRARIFAGRSIAFGQENALTGTTEGKKGACAGGSFKMVEGWRVSIHDG